MTTAEEFRFPVSEDIRSIALALPEATEGTSCVNRAFKAGGKNFAFLGEKDDTCGLRLKLGTSIDKLTQRAAAQPERYQVGKGGWTMMRFPPDDPPSTADLEVWILESYRILAPKKISAQLEP